jgi:hypothetical protein
LIKVFVCASLLNLTQMFIQLRAYLGSFHFIKILINHKILLSFLFISDYSLVLNCYFVYNSSSSHPAQGLHLLNFYGLNNIIAPNAAGPSEELDEPLGLGQNQYAKSKQGFTRCLWPE